MKAEVVFLEGRGDEVPTFAIEIKAETDQDRLLLSGMNNNPFNAAILPKSKGSVLRIYALNRDGGMF